MAPPKIRTVLARTNPTSIGSETINATSSVVLCPDPNNSSASETTQEQENEPPANEVISSNAISEVNRQQKRLDTNSSSAAHLKSSVLVGSNQAHPINVPFSQGFVASVPVITSPEIPMNSNSVVSNMPQQSNIFGGIHGRQYIALDNGCYMEVVSDQYDQLVKEVSPNEDHQEYEPVPASASVMSTESDMSKILLELQKINTRLDVLEQRMGHLMQFIANMDKFMSTKNATSVKTKHEPEDFAEIRELWPILSENELETFEKNLKDKQYADKVFRFFDSEYNLNGKRDGKSFFKTIVRRMIAPILLQPFSWTGGSRRTVESMSFVPNRSFRDTFRCLVQFVQRVTVAADMDHTSEQTDACFSLFLRQKKVEIERFLSDNPGKRAAGSRSRKPKLHQTCDEPKTEYELEIEENAVQDGCKLDANDDEQCMSTEEEED